MIEQSNIHIGQFWTHKELGTIIEVINIIGFKVFYTSTHYIQHNSLLRDYKLIEY